MSDNDAIRYALMRIEPSKRMKRKWHRNWRKQHAASMRIFRKIFNLIARFYLRRSHDGYEDYED